MPKLFPCWSFLADEIVISHVIRKVKNNKNSVQTLRNPADSKLFI